MGLEDFGEQEKGNGFQSKETQRPNPPSLQGMLSHLHEDILHAIALADYNRFLLFCIGAAVVINSVMLLILAFRL